MPYIPFLGRLNVLVDLRPLLNFHTEELSLIYYRSEYIALVGSFLLVGFEALIRILTLALRMYMPDP
jgi:hypothetical protein